MIMWKYKCYKNDTDEIIFSKPGKERVLDAQEFGRVMSQKEGLHKGLGLLLFYGNTTTKFKAINTFPEILEDYYNQEWN